MRLPGPAQPDQFPPVQCQAGLRLPVQLPRWVAEARRCIRAIKKKNRNAAVEVLVNMLSEGENKLRSFRVANANFFPSNPSRAFSHRAAFSTIVLMQIQQRAQPRVEEKNNQLHK